VEKDFTEFMEDLFKKKEEVITPIKVKKKRGRPKKNPTQPTSDKPPAKRKKLFEITHVAKKPQEEKLNLIFPEESKAKTSSTKVVLSSPEPKDVTTTLGRKFFESILDFSPQLNNCIDNLAQPSEVRTLFYYYPLTENWQIELKALAKTLKDSTRSVTRDSGRSSFQLQKLNLGISDLSQKNPRNFIFMLAMT